MIAVAMVNDKPKQVLDLRDLLDMLQRDYQLSTADVMDVFVDAIVNENDFPEIGAVIDAVCGSGRAKNYDGVIGDDFYEACRGINDAREEIRNEIENLRSNKRKGNTKEDIARRLEAVVSNMGYIL